MGKDKPNATEYLLKETTAFREFYPEVSFEIVESGEARAELVFTEGCLGVGDETPGLWPGVIFSLGRTTGSYCPHRP